MYIALKWLTGLATAMWVAMCCVDLFVKYTADHTLGPVLDLDTFYENLTIQVTLKPEPLRVNYRQNVNEQSSVAMIHCYMFFAGALAVSIFNKKTEIILYTKSKVSKIDIKRTMNWVKIIIEPCAQRVLEMLRYSRFLNYYSEIMSGSIKSFISLLANKRSETQHKINMTLLKKLQESGEERRNLGQLLIAAIHENKNIRMQYQLESMAKTRLLRHIDDTNKQIKENRSRYVSFQHLYLVTHQENIFLKARVRNLQKEKEEAEKNLLSLINEVYKSKNKELKAYCSRFIVHTKHNLLNSDVSEEIRKFLLSQRPKTNKERETDKSNADADANGVRITEILNEDDGLVPLVCDAPKLKGLPGEYVWTVKDKDGIIEKLYEYDFETDLDNGDTIRRIRKYSVYCDEECLLDYHKSNTTITEAEPRKCYSYSNLNLNSLGQRRFLTGSRAFQRFLRDNNHGIVQTPMSAAVPSPLQISG